MLGAIASLDLHLDRLIFINNTNLVNDASVCLDLTLTVPSIISVNNSLFRGNQAMYGTLAKITGAKGIVFSRVTAEENVATSTSSGLMFTPLTTIDTYVQIVDCTFRRNTALRGGVVYVSEMTGNMILAGTRLTVTIQNNTFVENNSKYGGCSLSVSGFIALSYDSAIRKNSYINNDCAEGGAAAYVSFVSGALSFEGSLFEGNFGLDGTAIFSTHQGSVDESTYIKIEQCTFNDNVGRSVVQLAGIENPLLLTSANTFAGNKATCIYITTATWRDQRSIYTRNSAPDGGVLVALDGSIVAMDAADCSFNSAQFKGGVMFVSTNTIVRCANCVFSRNSCADVGGVASIHQKSTFNCTACQLTANSVGDKGAALYSLSSSSYFTNSTIANSVAENFGAVFLSESSSQWESVEFSENYAPTRSPGVILSMSNLTARHSTFHSQSADTGGFFFGTTLIIITIEDSEIMAGKANYGAVADIAISSTLIIRRSVIRSCTAVAGGSLAQIRAGALVLQEVKVYSLLAPVSNGAIFAIQSDLQIEACLFSAQKGSVAIVQLSTVTMKDCTVEYATAAYGPVVNCVDCYSVTVANSSLRNNLAKQGGAIYSYTTGFLEQAMESSFTGNNFTSNRAVNGGAIYSNSIQMELAGNEFFNNTALKVNYDATGLLNQGVGGAVFAVCEFISFCNFRIHANKFEENVAEKRGGAIYWFDSYPEIRSNTMINNQAKYGSDIASFAIKLMPMTINNVIRDYLNNDTVPLTHALQNIGSGHLFEEVITYALIDHYENVVTDDSSSSAQILADQSNISISGNTQAIAVNGIFTFSKLAFTGAPTTTQTLNIQTSGVNLELKEYAQDPSTYIDTVSISLSFRACEIGESLQGLDCYVCPVGTFSLDPSDPCNSCPSHVTCYGNFTMTPDAGYWRPEKTLNLWFKCPNPDACLGSPSNLWPLSLTGICAEGYESNLCNICKIGFSRQGKDKCGKCPSLTSNIIVSTLIVLVALSFGAVIVILAIRGASRPRSEIAIHLKIFMNYLQMVVVAASLNLNWPDFVSIFLNGQDTAGSFTEQLFSFDCIMQKFTSGGVFYTKVRVTALMPAGLLLFSLLVWLFISVCSRIQQLLHKLIASLVMIIFVLHPSLTKIMFSMFSCMEIMPGQLWLVSDLSLRCWSSEHIQNILFVSVSSISLWIFGLPVLCLLFLFRMRGRLSDPLTQLKFSFIYKGYHPKWYYWEFVILYRKVALVCASVFLSTVSIMVQALSVLAVLLISLFFQLQVQPFIVPVLNRLELKSILVSSVTIYSGLFYQTESIGNFHSAIHVKVLLFVAILLTNGYFLLSWVKCVLPLVIETLRRRFNIFTKRHQVQPHPVKRSKYESGISSMDFINSSKMTHEIAPPSQSDVSGSHITPVEASDVPENSPYQLEVEYSQPEHQDPKEDISQIQD